VGRERELSGSSLQYLLLDTVLMVVAAMRKLAVNVQEEIQMTVDD